MEQDSIKIVYQQGMGEVVEKKSRFIAHVFPIAEENEALEYIEQIKKEYWDARHNCFAYVLGERQELQRFSDDGEPSGTAGKPILEVLLGEEIHNTLVVVTRYFGGTLLGTGGLVRAYSSSTKAGLDASVVTELCKGTKIAIKTDYNGLGKLQYLLGELEISILDTAYTDAVKIYCVISTSQYPIFQKKFTEITAGKGLYEELSVVDYVKVDKTITIVKEEEIAK